MVMSVSFKNCFLMILIFFCSILVFLSKRSLILILHFSNVHSVAVLTFTLCPLLAGALHNSDEFLLLIIRSLTNAGFASTISFCSNNLIVLFLHLSRAGLVMVLTLHWKEDHGCEIKDYLQNENVTHWKRGSRCR